MEGIRKEIRQKSSLCILYALNIRNQAQRASISDASYYRIQTDRCKFLHKGLCSDPVVA